MKERMYLKTRRKDFNRGKRTQIKKPKHRKKGKADQTSNKKAYPQTAHQRNIKDRDTTWIMRSSTIQVFFFRWDSWTREFGALATVLSNDTSIWLNESVRQSNQQKNLIVYRMAAEMISTKSLNFDNLSTNSFFSLFVNFEKKNGNTARARAAGAGAASAALRRRAERRSGGTTSPLRSPPAAGTATDRTRWNCRSWNGNGKPLSRFLSCSFFQFPQLNPVKPSKTQ